MRPLIIALLFAMLLALSATAQETCPKFQLCSPDRSCPAENRRPQICPLFHGSLSFRSAEGVAVVMQQWQIANGETAEIPHQGLLIVQLRGGEVVTEIGDQQNEWHVGSFWSVPAGKRLIVHTARDSALLQTVDFIAQ